MVFLVLLLAFQALAQEKMRELEAAKSDLEKAYLSLEEKNQNLKEIANSRKKYQDEVERVDLNRNAEKMKGLLRELAMLEGKFPKGTITTDSKTGEVRIDDKILFDTGKAVLKPEGKRILDQVVPEWSAIVTRPEYAEIIKEVVFEGHADAQGVSDPNENYLQNLALTQNRSVAVARYVFRADNNFEHKEALRSLVSASGRSNVEALKAWRAKDPGLKDSELLKNANNRPSKQHRRVSLKLILKNPLIEWQLTSQDSGSGSR
jgi:outer membrane protein OmpA-like peptidoglycan-associated protein